jgi:hypothetical protein
VPERVALDDGGDLVARAHDHRRVHAERLGDLLLEVALEPLRGDAARQDDVAALHERLDVAVAVLGQELAELRHAHAVAAAEVDSPK